MSMINRLKQLAVAGIALTSFAEASNNVVDTQNDTVGDIPATAQSHQSMDAKTAAGKLYQQFRTAEETTPKLSDEMRAQIAHDFIQDNNISDKNVYDMTLNYSKYVTDYMRHVEKEKVNNKVLPTDTEAVYSAFTQTNFYQTERNRIIKRWMSMAENVSEGYYRYGYKCTADQPTIGIGTCLTTSGLSLNDIPIRHIQKDENNRFVYNENGEPVAGEELTLAEKQSFVRSLNALTSSSYAAGAKLTQNLGIYGLTLQEARQVASLECQKKMDDILKFAFLTKKVDLFKEPIALGVLALDIHYQCGSLTSAKEWPNFWKCVCNKKYGNLRNHITVNGGKNVSRHKVKEALCDYIAADYNAKHETNEKKLKRAYNSRTLAYEKMCGYGVDIGLRRTGSGSGYYPNGTGMAKATSAKPTLKKREVSEEKKAEFEKIKKEIDQANATSPTPSEQNAVTYPTTNAPYISTSSKTLRELQKKTRALPKDKRAKRMNRQELTELARQNNINSKNLIHLTTAGGVDINVCLNYLKEETQKINTAIMQKKHNQGR